MEGGLPLSDMGVILKSGGGVGQKKLALSFLLVSVLFTGCSGDIPPVPVLIKAGVISGGMIPKVECCVDAVKNGVRRTHILDGRIPHSILIEVLSHAGIGTMIW